MPKKTKENILNVSCRMFNEKGVDAISIAQIASEMSISTGNLTYHLSRKKDIVAAHLNTLKQELSQTVVDFPYTGTAAEYYSALFAMFDKSWDYRYLFNGGNYLIHQELLTRDEYASLIDKMYFVTTQQCEKLIDSGAMKPIPEPNNIKTLVDCIWWQWLGWLGSNLLEGGQTENRQQIVQSGLKHMLFLFQPYLNEHFIQQVYQQFDSAEQPLADAS